MVAIYTTTATSHPSDQPFGNACWFGNIAAGATATYTCDGTDASNTRWCLCV